MVQTSSSQTFVPLPRPQQRGSVKHGQTEMSPPSLPVKLLSAGVSASFAEAVTIPVDTAKVRLQVSKLRNFLFLFHFRVMKSSRSLAYVTCRLSF